MAHGAATRRNIAENVKRVRHEIAEAAHRSDRRPEEIVLMAVTKTRTPEEVDAVIEAGVTFIGENRVQEAEQKKPQVKNTAEWHLVGHLQRNKAKLAVELFSMIQSLDSVRLAEKLTQYGDTAHPVDVLVEVNTSGEESKFGAAPDRAHDLVGAARGLGGLRLRGLMTVGLFSGEERQVRRCFETLGKVRDDLRSAYPDLVLDILSMGMTNDFRWAIAEGSTMVRIGTAIFGPRP